MTKEIDYFEEIRKAFGDDFITQEEKDSPGTIFDLIALSKGHQVCKKQLGSRVQILRILIHKHFKEEFKQLNSFEYDLRVEKYLDNILAKNRYKLELLIEKFRKDVIQETISFVCETCGYVEDFCVCGMPLDGLLI